jgi:hypothetical protein
MKARIWPAYIGASIGAWHYNRRVNRVAKVIAHDIFGELWTCARRKLTSAPTVDTELAEYTRVRAAQLVHGRLDEIMRANDRLGGDFRNLLLARSVEVAVDQVARAAESSRSPKPVVVA